MIPQLLIVSTAPPAPPTVDYLASDQVDISDLMPPMRDEVLVGMWMSSAPPAVIEDVPPGSIALDYDDIATWMMAPEPEETFAGAWRSAGPSAPVETTPPDTGTILVGIGVRELPGPEVWEASYVSTMGGRTPDVNAEFIYSSSAVNNWTFVTSPNSSGTNLDNYQTWFVSRPTRRIDLALGMCPWKDATSNQGVGLAEIPANISKFTTCAQQLANFGMQGTADRPIYIRLGWEMGSRGFPWATSDDSFTPVSAWMANYKSGFRSIVQTMKAAVQNNWKFVWCPMDWNWRILGLSWAEEIYPGDDVVDLVGMDHYDGSNAYSVTPTDAQRNSVWNNEHLPNLEAMNTFAVNHSKRQMFGEWGIWHDIGGGQRGGNDNPIFIQNTYDWVTSHNSSVSGFEYIVYFNRIVGGQVEHSLTNFGTLSKINSRNMYNATFSTLPHPW